MPGVYDSAEPATHKRITRAAVLPSGSPDTVGASDFGFFGAHNFGIPSLHAPLSNASSAGLPTALTWLGVRMVSLFLSCMTLSFTTSRRFIPTLSRRKRLPHNDRHQAGDHSGLFACGHGQVPQEFVQERLHAAERVDPPAVQQRLVHVVRKDDELVVHVALAQQL